MAERAHPQPCRALRPHGSANSCLLEERPQRARGRGKAPLWTTLEGVCPCRLALAPTTGSCDAPAKDKAGPWAQVHGGLPLPQLRRRLSTVGSSPKPTRARGLSCLCLHQNYTMPAGAPSSRTQTCVRTCGLCHTDDRTPARVWPQAGPSVAPDTQAFLTHVENAIVSTGPEQHPVHSPTLAVSGGIPWHTDCAHVPMPSTERPVTRQGEKEHLPEQEELCQALSSSGRQRRHYTGSPRPPPDGGPRVRARGRLSDGHGASALTTKARP
jgi:hypothetical protein